MFKNLSAAALGVSGRESEIIELALSNGFRGIDLDLVQVGEQVASRGLAHARRLIDSARLKVGSFALAVRLAADDADYSRQLEQLPSQLELAQQLGCPRATVTIAPDSDGRPYHENFELHRRRLSALGELADRFGIRLGVAFVAPHAARGDDQLQFIQTVDALVMLLQMVGSNDVGLALDLWHWHLGGGTLERLKTLSKNDVVSVTLSDATPSVTAETASDSDRRLPGEGGAIDAAAALAHLAAAGYDGPIAPAASPASFAGLGRDKIVHQAAAALDTVWKAAGVGVSGKLSAVSGK